MHLQRNDITLSDTHIYVTLRKEKGKAVSQTRRKLSIPLTGVRGLADLVRSWQSVQRASYEDARRTMPPDVSFWRLPDDTSEWTSSAATLDSWLQTACGLLGAQPPTGQIWRSHSLRKGAASASSAIDVALNKICFMGGWAATSGVVHTYISPVPADAAAFRFFGWMRAAQPPADSGQAL